MVSTDTFVSVCGGSVRGGEGMAHMQQEITLPDGKVQESNFHQQPLMRRKQIHSIEVYWIK